ncbi:MAG: hypothetical protein V4472_25465 [Pseudomonadota bacterium]
MATSLYVSPSDVQLLMPLGVNWKSLGGPNPTPNLNAMAILEACKTATRQVNSECGQSLQTAVRTESVMAPGHRCGILPDGTARFIASFSPIMAVLLAEVAYTWPSGNPAVYNYRTLNPGQAFPEYTAPSDDWQSAAPGTAAPGQNAILITGGAVNWCNGRMGERVQMFYLNGWPNSQLTAEATSGTSTLTVDDVTGWAGVAGELYDGERSEGVFVKSVTAANSKAGTPVGPGTLMLQAPLVNTHTPSVTSPLLVSAMPHGVRWAAGLFSKAVALRQGATVVSAPGGKTQSSSGSTGAIEDALHEAALSLGTYRRTSF